MKPTMHTDQIQVQTNRTSLKTLVGCSLLLLLPAAHAQFAWPVYEPFGQYPTEPQRLGMAAESGANWNFGNSIAAGVSSFMITNTGAMSFPALLADSNTVPKGIQAFPNNGSADRGATFTPQTGTVYASFLLNYQSANGATMDRSIFQLAPNAVTNDSFSRVWTAVWLTPDHRLRLTKNFNAANHMATADFSEPTPVIATNVTHLVVMRYLRIENGQDIVDLWVDPLPFGDGAQIPPPTITSSNAADVAQFNSFALSNRRLNGAASVPPHVFQIDEIRIGDSWASVTPLATPPPGPIFAVTGGGTVCPGTDVHVGLSGSVVGNDYLLYTNNVYSEAALAGTGAALDFGVQTTLATYSILASNTATADIGWMSNSVHVAITQPPVIVTEPKPVVTTANNWASFSADVTGDDLSFQWHRNGAPLEDDAHRTGSATSELVISPVSAADVGDYHLVVTNSCGSIATSVTVSLSLHTPDDLVWSGDAFNINIWDVADHVEWMNNGNPSVFNPGDNVTFDDTYAFPNAIVLEGFLTPSKMTVDASRDYTWSGSGTIGGPGSLVKTGTGVLTLNNNPDNSGINSYTGGTIISNGVVNITNSWYRLGSGPVTLAGGTLQNWQKGSAGGPGLEQGLTNDLVIAANSTWQLDRTGDQAGAFLGGLAVNPGTTLTLYHSATNQNQTHRFRIGSVFTNNLNIVATVNPLATNTALDIGTYNNSGVQVYNGTISGENTGFLVVGSGGVYLNGANTYTRDTTTFVGFLAGSGSIDGQLVVNSGTTIGGGSQTAIGTFTVNSNITLNGNVLIRVDKSLAQSNDVIAATGTIVNGGTGTVTVTNLGAADLAQGDRFKIFSGPVGNGAALTVAGEGVTWANNLEVDGTIEVASVIATNPTNLTVSVSGGMLNIAWPQTHLGWILQSQTNSLATGLSTNWQDVTGTGSSTMHSIPLNSEQPAVFYRLRQP